MVTTLLPRIVAQQDAAFIADAICKNGTPKAYVEPTLWAGEVALALLQRGCRSLDLQTPISYLAEAWEEVRARDPEFIRDFDQLRSSTWSDVASSWANREFSPARCLFLAYKSHLPLRFSEVSGRGQLLQASRPRDETRLVPIPKPQDLVALQDLLAPTQGRVFFSSWTTQDFLASLEVTEGTCLFIDLRIYPDAVKDILAHRLTVPTYFLHRQDQSGIVSGTSSKTPTGLSLVLVEG